MTRSGTPNSEAPWPVYTEKQAASVMGVSRQVVQQMGYRHHDFDLRLWRAQGSSGGTVVMYCRCDIDKLAARFAESRGKVKA